jgi:hypothetical protein
MWFMTEVGSDDEPVWRARARVVAVAFLVLSLLTHLADDEPGLRGIVGPILAGVFLWLRRPVGVAVLIVNVVMELLDVFVSYRELGFVGALGHVTFVLGLGAIALVLYQRSESASFERWTTTVGVIAMVAGLATVLGPSLSTYVDPHYELGDVTVVRGGALPYTMALPGVGWRSLRRPLREDAGFDAWVVRTNDAGEVVDEIFVSLEVGVPSGTAGLDQLTSNPFDVSQNREVVDEGTHRWVHGRFLSDLGVTQWRSCRMEVVHGFGVTACVLVHGDTTPEHMAALTAAVAAARWGP